MMMNLRIIGSCMNETVHQLRISTQPRRADVASKFPAYNFFWELFWLADQTTQIALANVARDLAKGPNKSKVHVNLSRVTSCTARTVLQDMAGIKRAAREEERPIAKKAKVHIGTKTNSVGHRAMAAKRTKDERSSSMCNSDALSESDGSDLDSDNDLNEEIEEPYKESKPNATLRNDREDGDGADVAMNG